MATYSLFAVGPNSGNSGVLRDDGVNLISSPTDPDWIAYQAWLAAGNTPRPIAPGSQYDWNGTAWVVNPARQAIIDAAAALGVDLSAVKATGPIVTFMQMSPAQIDAYIDTNFPGATAPVPNLRVVLKVLAKVLVVIARDRITQ
jgi:hypothetical protein